MKNDEEEDADRHGIEVYKRTYKQEGRRHRECEKNDTNEIRFRTLIRIINQNKLLILAKLNEANEYR